MRLSGYSEGTTRMISMLVEIKFQSVSYSFQVNDDEILEDKCELEWWGFVTFSGVKPTLPIIHSQNIIFQSPNKYMPIIINSLSALKHGASYFNSVANDK